MDWRIKAIVQGALARLPGGERLNDGLQQLVGGRKDPGAHIDIKFTEDWLVHMRALRETGHAIAGRDSMEIGTGWLPVFPLCFHLAGARRCHTFDLNRHLRAKHVRPTLMRLERHLPAIAEASGEPEAAVRERWLQLMAVQRDEEILDRAGVVYHAPADASRTGLPDASIGLVFSNSVLEHVSASVLGALMRETRRILEPDGVVLHSVNCGDHYAYFDRSITPIHYLRYSERQWRWWNNDVLYQNRLRPVDFLQSAREAGLVLTLDWQKPRPALMAMLDTLPIDAAFRHYAPEQLCCTSVTFAATPRPASGRGLASSGAEPLQVVGGAEPPAGLAGGREAVAGKT
jgi:hypothetical protein